MRKRGMMLIICMVMLWGTMGTSGIAVGHASDTGAGTEIVQVLKYDNEIVWLPQVSCKAMDVIISMPGGEIMHKRFESGMTPHFTVAGQAGSQLIDGTYTWEIRVVPLISADLQRQMDEIRKSDDELVRQRFWESTPELHQDLVQSGTFLVAGGLIVGAESGQERPYRDGPDNFDNRADSDDQTRDQVIADDLLVTGGLCVGFDCADGEAFSFITLKLKENNTRLYFDDTSATSGFPYNDWQLTANDTANGGANYFAITDITNSKVPVTIEANTPSNTLYIDSAGRIGNKTNSPVLDFHIATGNTPGVRLEQNGASGFTPQTWDIAGNEANFFIRDVTGGSQLSFRITPGADTNSLVIDSDNDIGMGVVNALANLHIQRASDISILMRNATSSDNWAMQNTGDGFVLAYDNAATPAPAGLFTLGKTGDLTISGVMTQGSSRTIKENFSLIDRQQVIDRLMEIPVLEWNYTADTKNTKHAGPLAEDFYAAFGLGEDERHLAPSDVMGVALAAIQEMNLQIEEKERRIAELESRNADVARENRDLEHRLAALEAAIAALREAVAAVR